MTPQHVLATQLDNSVSSVASSPGYKSKFLVDHPHNWLLITVARERLLPPLIEGAYRCVGVKDNNLSHDANVLVLTTSLSNDTNFAAAWCLDARGIFWLKIIIVFHFWVLQAQSWTLSGSGSRNMLLRSRAPIIPRTMCAKKTINCNMKQPVTHRAFYTIISSESVSSVYHQG